MAGVDSLLVPGSLAIETQDPRLATYKIGLIGRACAIFGVDEVVVYEDPEHREGRTVARILEYQATAPYLRKRLFPISEELKHVGVLPPLNLPAHIVPRWVNTGDIRYGTRVGDAVDIGLDQPAELSLPEDAQPPETGKQFPVKVLASRKDRVVVTPYEPDPDEPMGFEVHRAPNLTTALRGREPVVGTSREGEPLAKRHLDPQGIALAFGTPERGLQAVLDREPDFPLVNTIPDQRTRTVRVEEAVLSTLGLIHGVRSGLPV